MAVEVHVAELGLFHVDPTGNVYQRGRAPDRTIKQNLAFDTQHRIVADASNPNTANNPTIKAYLEAEAVSGFEPVQLFQSMVITKKVTTEGSA